MRPKATGFTIIELMFAIAIGAIILSLGIPNFSALIEKTRVRRAAQDIVELLQLARLTAVEQRTNVAICGSSDGNTCDQTAEDWGNRIIALYPDSQQVISVVNLSSRIQLENNVRKQVGFNMAGWGAAANSSFYVCPTTRYGHAYRIVIPQSGHIRMEPDTTHCPS